MMSRDSGFALLSLAIVFLVADAAGAAVIGFFELPSGRQGVVTAVQAQGFGPMRIFLSTPGRQPVNRLEFESHGWSLRGEEIAPPMGAVSGVQGAEIAIVTGGGTFFLPPFGSTYFLGEKRKADIYFKGKNARVRKIALPIRGGEIKAFKVTSAGLELLVFDRQSKRAKAADGRELFGVAPTGENIVINVTSAGAGLARRLASTDPAVFWSRNDRLFKVNEQSMRLEETASP